MICELLLGLAYFALVEGIEVEWQEHRAGSWESWVLVLAQALAGDLGYVLSSF